MESSLAATGVTVHGAIEPAYQDVLCKPALEFAAKLARKFETRRQELLGLRRTRQLELDRGTLPRFLPETRHIRESDWTVAPIPQDLLDRRVEITGPTDRKMVINALNSGASVFMADFEDANAPTWANMVAGQLNLRDAVKGVITYTGPDGKRYAVNDRSATLIVRPRGWHMEEKHVLVDGKPISGALFDFALYFFHNAKLLLARGTGPYFYLPKIESHLEARLWNDVFITAQRELGLPLGTIKATVLIETVLAAFEMDEILYEMRQHCVGLNIGRWDYIFSCIKKFRVKRDFCLADRAAVTMTAPFMRAYALLLIKTCHRRRAFAMGGMAAQIPIKGDATANETALEKVQADKVREVTDGCDGTWVAHPGLVAVAKAVFDQHMPGPNQIHRQRDDVQVTATDLLDFRPEQPITEAGMRNNIDVAIRYLGAWLTGNGCVPVNHLMEDAATAEIARSQLWQWTRSPKGVLSDGRKVSRQLFGSMLDEELRQVRTDVSRDGGNPGVYDKAAALLTELIESDDFADFLTLPAYERLVRPARLAIAA
jgi:malate synthase